MSQLALYVSGEEGGEGMPDSLQTAPDLGGDGKGCSDFQEGREKEVSIQLGEKKNSDTPMPKGRKGEEGDDPLNPQKQFKAYELQGCGVTLRLRGKIFRVHYHAATTGKKPFDMGFPEEKKRRETGKGEINSTHKIRQRSFSAVSPSIGNKRKGVQASLHQRGQIRESSGDKIESFPSCF